MSSILPTTLSRRKLISSGGVLIGTTILASCSHEVSNTLGKEKQRENKISGLDLESMDLSIRPQDDLYHFTNGEWLRKFDIPNDRSSYGTFVEIAKKTQSNIQEIIREKIVAPKTKEGEISLLSTLYENFNNYKLRNDLGFQPLDKYFNEIDKIQTKDDAIKVMAQNYINGFSSIFDFSIDADMYSADKYSFYIDQSGTTLPTKDFYLNKEYEKIQTEYKKTLLAFFQAANFSQPEIKSLQIFNLESSIAKIQWSPEELRDVDKSYTNVSLKGLYTNAPDFNWKLWLSILTKDKYKLGTNKIIMRQPTFLAKCSEIWKSLDIDTLKLLLKWQVIKSNYSYLSQDIVKIGFDFFGRILNGVEEETPNWEKSVNLLTSNLGQIIGKLYVEKHFPEQNKKSISKLVDNLIKAYRESLTNLDWMSPRTRNAAINKLQNINIKVGYPDKWEDYSELNLSKNNIVSNIEEINSFSFEKSLKKIEGPVDKDEWLMAPSTVNAYYNPTKNEIVFPAAILQSPFFDPNADSAVNYGGIGAVIGHEIGHGFDDQGSKFDGQGNRKDWWADEDRKRFEEKTNSLIKQYDKLKWKTANNKQVNGKLTVGENLADLGGLSIAIKAYEIELESFNDEISDQHLIDNYSDLQRLFINWSRIWKSKYRTETAVNLIETDPHSPSEFRANQVIRNIDKFYKAFDVKNSDKLFLPKEDRIYIW